MPTLLRFALDLALLETLWDDLMLTCSTCRVCARDPPPPRAKHNRGVAQYSKQLEIEGRTPSARAGGRECFDKYTVHNTDKKKGMGRWTVWLICAQGPTGRTTQGKLFTDLTDPGEAERGGEFGRRVTL